ncbi:MAG: heme exporter protein CcmD [Nitrospirae bacterium]|nr:heme exporter protein CcmD [Nitrospirota bacterium]
MNLTEFWHMGGYALYVWSSFGVTAAFMVGELVLLRRQRKETLDRLRRIRDIET